MKRAEWTREFWAKALAFACAAALVPLACVCGASLLAAYGFSWWLGGNEAYEKVLLWAQGKYWTQRGMRLLYGLHGAAIPLLVIAAALLLFLIVYLARVAGRQPEREEVVPGWQEKIPFDLYLAVDMLVIGLLIALGIDAAYYFDYEPLAYALLLLGAVTVGAAVLLALWMTLCTRVKIGKWWRNSVTFWVLRFCWWIVRRCWRALCAAGRGVLDLVRGIPLVWRTLLAVVGLSQLEFLTFLNSGMDEGNFFLWLLLRAAECVVLLFVAIQLRRLQEQGEALAAGDVNAKVDTSRMFWDFKRHGENLNDISRSISLAVDEQLKSERLKTELITNVSHDIKTPLTSIINYVGLLRRDPGEEQAKEYLEVLDRQSQRLKKLTEDLVEMSKASTGNMPVNASRRSVSELLVQALGEYSERLDRAQLDAVLTLPDREAFAWVDGTLLWRVLDNLFSNACKYALPGTRFYIDASESAGRVRLSFKNISRDRLNLPADELMERFVRGDSSRGGEGSGLGLNIARSLTELQGGTFGVSVDGDLFRVDITFPAIA